MLSHLVSKLILNASAPLTYRDRSKVFARSDQVRSVFILENGAVKLSRMSGDGHELILHHARGKAILAEASVYADRYHCDAICSEDSEIRSLSVHRFKGVLETNSELASMWATHLAHSLQAARFRSEILSLKKVEDRLQAWLSWNATLPAKGHWKDLAAEIGVSPEALYREIAKRKF